MAEPKKPQDHKPKQTAKKPDKEQQKILADFMSTGIDLTPFTADIGDGVEWSFKPDPMPADTERLRKAMAYVQDAMQEGEGSTEAFAELTDAIRACLIDPKQQEEFPKPQYGMNSLMWFAVNVATGKSGFPTE